ncbi:hypothetical protein GALMADRAFT_135395 [Galerina marginata CBS 339.88]|uniref:Peptidase S8/S53 domain-containing protein n=1 Tax=Galerina marginata (strain CBS 339.88) TaxID=685588 RepID=A0A067TI67_GALM3|nr:hypothetical protein GALMADRAFT_135395 [Galerina marginata CBS 339.88]
MPSFKSSSIFSLCLLAVTALGAIVPLREIEKVDGPTSGRLIVQLKEGASKDAILQHIPQEHVTHNWGIINGFAGNFNNETLAKLRASSDVISIAEDAIGSVTTIQTNAPWGLARLTSATKLANQDSNALTFTYTYNSTAGSGVDVYVIDTGILTTHTQFDNGILDGRATWGATFGPYGNADGNGHGTHCAGIVAGTQVGVAKLARVIAVKVFGDDGAGPASDTISGINYVAEAVRTSGRPSVASMSFRFPGMTSMDNAVAALISLGVHAAVAAGNENTDAGGLSPARVPSANTVGASTIADARVDFSNYGADVDIFAPGEDIISAWIGSDNAAVSLSGTSMATPHVAGIIAYLIGYQGNMSPAAMSSKLSTLSQKNVLSDIPAGTANKLAKL